MYFLCRPPNFVVSPVSCCAMKLDYVLLLVQLRKLGNNGEEKDIRTSRQREKI